MNSTTIKNSFFTNINENIECFNASSELLKCIIRKKEAKKHRRLKCFHSWRAVIKGVDLPLDEIETKYFDETNSADIHLVSNESHVEWIHKRLSKPAILLPYTTFQEPEIYQNYNLPASFDIIFSSLITPEHHVRKRVDLFLNLLQLRPDLRAVWIGGYHPYERWEMENAFNDHFNSYGPHPTDWDQLWTENESFHCWYHGGGIFRNEIQKHQYLYEQMSKARQMNLKIQFYINLTRNQIVHLINRSKVSLSLASFDQWPRCITEALACGTPVVCLKDLISGKQAVTNRTGVVASPNPSDILNAIDQAASLDRANVRSEYFSVYGISNGVYKLNEKLKECGLEEWSDIVSIQRPEELRVKRAIRLAIMQKN